ncbi:hypothetical protein DFJ74DRAFT_692301 [Hyaloraphidium curvatum]|nr:hypothetical protein DFJ74DRAFT_692301 [Hyaloraphidium curvatum]
MASPCLLCVGDLRCVAMVPCGHLLSCVFCAPRLEGGPCPACRRRVEGTLRIFPV